MTWIALHFWWTSWSPLGVWNRLRWAWQRLTRGYSERDTWSFDHYLAGVIAGGVREIRQRDIGYPNGIEPDEWLRILDEMAAGFEKWKADDWETVEQLEAQQKSLEHSLALFSKWFGALWD